MGSKPSPLAIYFTGKGSLLINLINNNHSIDYFDIDSRNDICYTICFVPEKKDQWYRRGRDRMVVGFTTTCK